MKLKNILKGWEQSTAPKRWSRSYSSKNGLTEFEQLGGKDTVSEDKHSEYWYKDPTNIVPAELKGDGKSFDDSVKKVHLGFHPELGDKEK